MPKNVQTLLGIPDIETLDLLIINCNAIDTQTQNEHNYTKTKYEYQHTNSTQETDKPSKCNINIGVFLNSTNGDTSMVIGNIIIKIKYFCSGPQQEADERASAEIMQHLQGQLKISIHQDCVF